MARRKVHQPTIRWVEKQYSDVNRDFFLDSLPKRVKFKIVKKADHLGECSRFTDPEGVLLFYQIEFNRDLWKCGKRLVFLILLHEMIHLAAGLENDHNEHFDAARERLMRQGAYDGVL